MKTELYLHTLNSSPNAIRRLFTEPVHVILTNINYDDDPSMLSTIKAKEQQFPSGSEYRNNPHSFFGTVDHFSTRAKTLVIDNFNLLVSNTLLRMNSNSLIIPDAIRHLKEEVDFLEKILPALQYERLVVISSCVDFDFTIETGLGELYAQLIYNLNEYAITRLDADAHLIVNGAFLKFDRI